MDTYDCDRTKAKQFFISAGYGGTYNSWFNDLNINEPTENLKSIWALFLIITTATKNGLVNGLKNIMRILAF